MEGNETMNMSCMTDISSSNPVNEYHELMKEEFWEVTDEIRKENEWFNQSF